jgi:catechol 2,3-dioxygenase-like lactoylglutathione lyase family enzyme
MIDHMGVSVSDYARSKAFYEGVLAQLGAALIMEVTPEMTGDGRSHAGFGRNGKPTFWISPRASSSYSHVALVAESREQVDAFHRAALAAGGRDNGAPGLRPHYQPNYYAAFVLDPDGHNIEAVCHCSG